MQTRSETCTRKESRESLKGEVHLRDIRANSMEEDSIKWIVRNRV
jgi:hypothetical protein